MASRTSARTPVKKPLPPDFVPLGEKSTDDSSAAQPEDDESGEEFEDEEDEDPTPPEAM
jgi:hypothetical protein